MAAKVKKKSTIGEQLSEARASKDISIEEMCHRLNVPRGIIEKVENNQFDLLASHAHARGYIRNFAREVGLDGWRLIRQYREEMGEDLDSVQMEKRELEAIPRKVQPNQANSAVVGGVMAGAAILAIVAILGYKIYLTMPEEGTKKTAEGTPKAEAVSPAVSLQELPSGPVRAQPAGQGPVRAMPVTPEGGGAPRPTVVQPVDSPPAAAPVAAAAVQNKLILNALPGRPEEETWVRVVALRGEEEVTLYDDVIPPGQTVPGQGQAEWIGDAFFITMREASAIRIIYNGRDYGTYDRPGVQRIRLPAENR
jgi:cytoskeleton protein RodZ